MWYWIQCFQVFDDVAVELTMALLQFFSEKPSEEHLFRTLKALSKFVMVIFLLYNTSYNNLKILNSKQLYCFCFVDSQVSADIPQLVQMIGPHPKSFKGSSTRCDELIDQISRKVRWISNKRISPWYIIEQTSIQWKLCILIIIETINCNFNTILILVISKPINDFSF